MPENAEIKKIIEQIDQEALKQKGLFGIYQYGGGSDESYIRANKEGLQLFALELLNSIEEVESNPDKQDKTAYFHLNESWIDSNSSTFIHYVELTDDEQPTVGQEHNETFSGNLIGAGCVVLFIILLISAIVGLVTLLQWIF